MRKQLITTIFIILFIGKTFSQENINYVTINQLTYSQFINGKWKELIETGKKSLKNGLDFHYLQTRMGISYYNLKKYRKSVKYFEKAYKSTSSDVIINEYLYYAYLFSGRTNDAKALSNSFSEDLKRRLNIKEVPIIESVIGYVKIDNYDNYRINKKFNEVLEQKIAQELSYYSINLSHNIKNKISILHGFSKIDFTNLAILQGPPNNQPERTETISQKQYYIHVNYHFGRGNDISFASHLVFTKTTANSPLNIPANQDLSVNTSDFGSVFFANYSKDITNFKFRLSTSVSNLNSQLKMQPTISLITYPLSNTKLYLVSEVSLGIGRGFPISNNKIFTQKIGFNIYKNFWLESEYNFGEISHYIENDAFTVNNGVNPLLSRYAITLNSYFAKGRLNILLKYQVDKLQNTYTINFKKHTVNFNNKSIIGGIKWNF